MVVLLSWFSGPFRVQKLRRFHLLQIPYSYSMEPYCVIPSQGFAAVLSCAPHTLRCHIPHVPVMHGINNKLQGQIRPAPASLGWRQTVQQLSSPLSPLIVLWFVLLASFTSRTRVSNLGRMIGGSCTSMPSFIAEVSIDFDFVAQVPFRRVYNY